MKKEDFNRYIEEEKKKIKDQFGLEAILKQSLWDAQVTDRNFNKAMICIVGIMKKCVENTDYKKQLYSIKNQKEENKPEKQTELEANLMKGLLDANVDEDEYDETFADIINFTKRCVENKDYKKMLYEIDLKNYRD